MCMQTKKKERPRELGKARRILAKRAYYGMTAIEMKFLAKDHFINALADEEMRRYNTLSRIKTLNIAIKLALEYDTMTKVEELRKRYAIHTIPTQDESNEVKAIEIAKEVKIYEIPKIEVASLDGLCDMIKELKQVIADAKAVTEHTPKTTQQLKNNGFTDTRFYSNWANRDQARRKVCWIRQSPEHYSSDCPEGNELQNSRQEQTVSTQLRP